MRRGWDEEGVIWERTGDRSGRRPAGRDPGTCPPSRHCPQSARQLSRLRHHSPAMRFELGITMYPFFFRDPQLQPLLFHGISSVSWVHPKNLNLGGRLGAVRLQGEEPHSNSQSTSSLTPFPPPLTPVKPGSRRPAPV